MVWENPLCKNKGVLYWHEPWKGGEWAEGFLSEALHIYIDSNISPINLPYDMSSMWELSRR